MSKAPSPRLKPIAKAYNICRVYKRGGFAARSEDGIQLQETHHETIL